jgi:hypothetical protein
MIRINKDKFNELQGGLSDTRFAAILGIDRSQLYRARKGYSAVGAGFLEGFMTAYPEQDVRDYFKCSGRINWSGKVDE